MDSNVATVLAAAVAGALGIIGAWFSARAATKAAMKKSDSAERVAIRQSEAGAYERAKQFYEGTLTRMQGEIDRQSRQINNLQHQVSRLSRQVRDAGLVPVTSSEEEM